MRLRSTVLVLASCIVAHATLAPGAARAGGTFLTDRGVRALGRGYALVAGLDDASALWANPAGLAFANRQLFVDAAATWLRADFTRIDGGGATLPTVSLSARPIPVPMVAYVDDFGAADWTFGFGLMTPSLVSHAWPEALPDGGPAPQRYSLLTTDGSALTHVTAGAAWRPAPELALGLDLQLVVGTFRSRQVLSACDGVICSFPESPEWDAVAEVELAGVLGFTGVLGVTYDLGATKLALAFGLPHSLAGEATLRVRLPEAALFDGAHVEGDAADVDIDLPWVLRAGVEVAPVEPLRVEAAVVYEGWSVQDALSITPENVWLRDVVSLGSYQVGPTRVPREMNDVLSVRLGAEYFFGRRDGAVRGGFMYETGSFDDAYLTPLTLDSDKLVVGIGFGLRVAEDLWLDGAYGHVFLADRTVRQSQVPQPSSIRPAPDAADVVYVGNGDYSMEADVFGLALRWDLPARRADAPAEAAPSAPTSNDGPAPAPSAAPEPPTTADPAPEAPPAAEPPVAPAGFLAPPEDPEDDGSIAPGPAPTPDAP